MAIPLSGREEAIFAALVGQLDDPERRRLRRLTLILTSWVLAAAALLVVVLGAPWTVLASFSVAFVSGIALGWAFLARRSCWYRSGR